MTEDYLDISIELNSEQAFIVVAIVSFRTDLAFHFHLTAGIYIFE